MSKHHYVSNKKLYENIVLHARLTKEGLTANKDFRMAWNDIARDFRLIAMNYTNKYNLRDYDDDSLYDMQMECVVNMLKKLEKFNADLYNNPFAYFTQIAKNTLIHEIKRNKKHWDNCENCSFSDSLGETEIEGI